MGYTLGQEGVSSAVVGHVGMEIFEENVSLAAELAKRPAAAAAHERQRLQARLAAYAGPHALCRAQPGYRDRWA